MKKVLVLIVDDSLGARQELIKMLKRDKRQERYEIIQAENGVKAIEIAIEKRPDIILLDVVMPEINGLNTFKQLQADERTSDIPVIFVTGKEDTRSEYEALKMGAYHYLRKDVYWEVLVSAVNAAIERSEATRMNKLLMDSLPHPAMIINRSKVVLAANKVALSAGVKIGEYCWKEFGKCDYLCKEDRILAKLNPDAPGIKCTFCLADKAMDSKIPTNDPEVEAFGRIWDTYWVPIDKENYLHYCVDVTERKQTEEILRQEQILSNFIIDGIPGAFYVLDKNGCYKRWNAYQRDEIIGKMEEEIAGMSALETIHPEDRDLIQSKIANVIENGVEELVEGRVLLRGGSEFRWLLMTGQRMIINDEHFLVGIGIDITQRKEAEEALKSSQRHLQDVIEFFPDATLGIDRNGCVIVWNKAIEEMTGVLASEMIGRGDHAYTVPFYGEARPQLMDLIFEDHAKVRRLYPQIIQEGESLSTEVFCNELYGGRGAWVSAKAAPLHDEFGNIIGAIESIRDITERKEMETDLQESRESYRALVKNSPDVVMRFDRNFRHLYVNDVVESQTQRKPEEFIGKTHEEMGFPAEACEFWQTAIQIVFDTKSLYRTEFTIPQPNGTLFYIDWILYPEFSLNGEVATVITTARDITDRKRIEDQKEEMTKQLIRSQKMEALGVLAGGMAHDINNKFQIIVGATEAIAGGCSKEDLAEFTAAIQNTVADVKKLTVEVLTFARKEEPIKEPSMVNSLIRDMLGTLEKGFSKKIKITTDLQVNLLPVEMNVGQIKQVLTNICINARDAMPDGGVLRITTKDKVLDEKQKRPGIDLKPGKYCLISIIDNGAGIERGVLENIFNPFFTTKDVGKGTGLGLSISYGIIRNHGGHIDVFSKPGDGTKFHIYLPSSELGVTKSAEREEVINNTTQHKATILLVDDERRIVEFTGKLLERSGFKVTTCFNGFEAIEIFRQKHAEIDIVVLDYMMPGITGHEIFLKIKTIDPDVKVIIASGYSEEGGVNEILHLGARGFVQKPFEYKDLVMAIQKVLYTDQEPKP